MTEILAVLAALALGLARAPYVGVACHAPNSTVCNRVGIAIWLRRPALAATAVLGGRRVRLHPGGLGGRGPTYWEGYVRVRKRDLPRGWYGGEPPFFLRLRINLRYPTGTARGTVRVLLHPGWG